jgi:uncharacterized cupredoxin-like copper-binding protein
MRKTLLVAVALAAFAAVPLASGGGTNASVNVTLKEFKVIPSVKSVKAGKVTFIVKNTGKVMHEMVVVKSTKAPGSLAGTGKEASEKGSVGEVPDVKAGKGGKLTVTLKPGKYVLLCNLPGHYKAGQYVGFTVK